MNQEDYGIERRLAEALRAATGQRASAEGAQSADGNQTRGNVERLAGAVQSLASRLEGLLRPLAPSPPSFGDVAAAFNPILGGLLRLFAGSGAPEALRLPPGGRPDPVRYEAAFDPRNSSLFLADRDFQGRIRAAENLAATPIVVRVEALDSRSFVERAPEIAEALRKVLLESDGIRSVLDE